MTTRRKGTARASETKRDQYAKTGCSVRVQFPFEWREIRPRGSNSELRWCVLSRVFAPPFVILKELSHKYVCFVFQSSRVVLYLLLMGRLTYVSVSSLSSPILNYLLSHSSSSARKTDSWGLIYRNNFAFASATSCWFRGFAAGSWLQTSSEDMPCAVSFLRGIISPHRTCNSKCTRKNRNPGKGEYRI